MNYRNVKSKVFAAEKLLNAQTTTFDKFRSIQELLKDVHPDLDASLTKVRVYIDKIEKIQKGQIIELSAEHLPEETEEQKKRKKLLLFLIRSWKDLQSEVKRVEHEAEVGQGQRATIKILSAVKGPFGLITLAAVLVVAGIFLVRRAKTSPAREATSPGAEAVKVHVITVNGQHIRVSDLEIGTGSDCDAPHYHAKDLTSVKTIEGSVLLDPGGCGFGKVADMMVSTINVP